MKFGVIPFPDIEELEAAVSSLEGAPADYIALTAAVNGLWSYLSRSPTVDQWTALTSLALELGADVIGPSHFLRLFNVKDDAKALVAFGSLGGDAERRASEMLLLFQPEGPQ